VIVRSLSIMQLHPDCKALLPSMEKKKKKKSFVVEHSVAHSIITVANSFAKEQQREKKEGGGEKRKEDLTPQSAGVWRDPMFEKQPCYHEVRKGEKREGEREGGEKGSNPPSLLFGFILYTRRF